MNTLRTLIRTMSYILGRHPDAYGLIPEENGFVRLRHLLHALHEEEGFRHIREVDILEVVHQEGKSLFEVRDGWIRTMDQARVPSILECSQPPKVLYTCVRRKGYGTVLADGIRPTAYRYVWLVPDSERACRLGRRIDSKPVVIAVHTKTAIEAGGRFLIMGELYLSTYLPKGSLMGPPFEKVIQQKKDDIPTKPDKSIPEDVGGFRIDLDTLYDHRFQVMKSGRKKRIDWKSQRRKTIREG
ncbi:MAG: RNA 2'-phosphotransferase [Thermodesulfobacteriota bacterium]